MTDDERKEYQRRAAMKHREKVGKPTKRSYTQEAYEAKCEADALRKRIDRLEIMLAWEYGQLSEGTAAKLLGTDRVTVRAEKREAIARGAGFDSWEEMERYEEGLRSPGVMNVSFLRPYNPAPPQADADTRGREGR
jgi:hypothetical protein